jgi:hypothetical protein
MTPHMFPIRAFGLRAVVHAVDPNFIIIHRWFLVIIWCLAILLFIIDKVCRQLRDMITK